MSIEKCATMRKNANTEKHDMQVLAVRPRLGETGGFASGALPEVQAAELGYPCGRIADGKTAEEEGILRVANFRRASACAPAPPAREID